MQFQDAQRREKRLPLDGMVILDLSIQVPGPYCSMILADLGAEVIKIENTREGDPARLLPFLYNSLNRNKKSICLNLKSPAAKDIFYRLARRADVLIEGFRPGVCQKLNVDYETIKNINPQIVYCSITGYGQEGPYRNKPGHDINYLGYAGILSLEEDLHAYSKMPAIPLADVSGSMFAAISILTALLARKNDGIGQYIDVSMTAGVFSWLGASLSSGFQGQKDSESLYIPHYGLFRTQNGKWISLGIVHEDHFWNKLCNIMDINDWASLDLFTRIARREEISALIKKIFLTRNLEEWLTLLNKADIPCGPVYNLEESFTDAQTQYRQADPKKKYFGQEEKQFRAFPAIFSEFDSGKNMPPPSPGMHTFEILRTLGHTDDEIRRLLKEQVVG
ncbi:MAG TPA: CaiB/BaiF CoA-transferase family protein [Smithellaceae bacterium]|nr:CaiB/BaiF CoA-transferase family protein [Smithellaceae bacterium]